MVSAEPEMEERWWSNDGRWEQPEVEDMGIMRGLGRWGVRVAVQGGRLQSNSR